MLEDQFHFQLLKCFNHQKRWINQRTIQIDVLPGQSKVLQCLDEHGPLSPKEIGKKNQNHDKRSILIHLTKLGKEKAQLVKQICLESNHFILQGLSKKEQREIIHLLKQMNNTLEKEDTHGNTK